MGRGKSWSAPTFGLMMALCGVAGASPGSGAPTPVADEEGTPAVCFVHAMLQVQMEIVTAQLDGEAEVLNELIDVEESRKDPGEALLLEMHAQMEEISQTWKRAKMLMEWFMEVSEEATLRGCDAVHLARIS